MRPRIAHALLLHGAGGGGWEWNAWHSVLAASGIAPRAPDLQAAERGLVATTLEDYGQQAFDALVALPRPRALIGASLGGLLAMRCAGEADALVLVNPLPPLPWAGSISARVWPEVVPWRREARFASTRRALPDADEATALYAFARWRDESGGVLRAAHAGIEVEPPACPVLCVISKEDEDVPTSLTRELAAAWHADVLQTDSPSHVGPLLGRGAPSVAARVAAWLSAR